MKSFTVVAFAALALLAAFSSAKNIESKIADKDFLIKEKFILDILQHIYQDDVFTTKYDSSFYEYKPWDHMGDYNHVELLEGFFKLWQHKPMYDDEIFSVLYDRHVEYAVGLSRLFYFAKDWDTFTHAVFWARIHVNKQLFLYALTTASLHRPDMVGIVFPAIYEIMPWFFFDVDTIDLAEKYQMQGFHKVKKIDNIYNVAIKTNYTNVYGDINYEHNLAYFLEDIGLNAFYYYYNMDYPFWTKGAEGMELQKDRRGEFWLYTHWQLLTRYYLERLSNDLGDIEYFNMYETAESGYHSGLRYYPGVGFPNRDNMYSFYYGENVEYMRLIELYSVRVMDFIHKNKKDNIEAVNMLGNIIQGNVDSIDMKYYGSISKYFRYIVNEGKPYGKHHETLPSTFMQYETTLRDPLFFQVYKEILHYYWHLAGTFPEYTDKDFVFDGVKINKVHLPDHLTTYFEYYDADISNAVNVEPIVEGVTDPLITFGRNSHHDGNSFVIKARQLRLNHKPFQFQLDVNSDKAQKAAVKVWIGPEIVGDKYSFLENNYMNFFELDHFMVDLVSGANTITRNSEDFSWWVDDRTTYLSLYKKVMDATNSDYKFSLNQKEAHCGVPQRLMLPKGQKGGMKYEFFFMVYPFHEPTVKQYSGYDPIISCGIGSGARWVDALPLGFPFNRPVKHGYYFDVDNFKFVDVTIVHKEDATNMV